MQASANAALQAMINHPIPSVEEALIEQEESKVEEAAADESSLGNPVRIDADAGQKHQNFPVGLEWTLIEIGIIERLNRIEYIQSQAAIDAARGVDARVSKYANPNKPFASIFGMMSNLDGEAALEHLIKEGRKGIDAQTASKGAENLIYAINCILDSATRAIARSISFAASRGQDTFFRTEAGATENEGLSGNELANAQHNLEEELKNGRMIQVSDEEMFEIHAVAALKELVRGIKADPIVQTCLKIAQPARITRRNGRPFKQQMALFVSEANEWDPDSNQFIPVSLEQLTQPGIREIQDVPHSAGFDKDTMLF